MFLVSVLFLPISVKINEAKRTSHEAKMFPNTLENIFW